MPDIKFPVEISLQVDDLSLWCAGATVEQLAYRVERAFGRLRSPLAQYGLQTSEGLVATSQDAFSAVAQMLAASNTSVCRRSR
jgi:hypothetical protein